MVVFKIKNALISATLLSLALFFPSWLSWLCFFYLVPLFKEFLYAKKSLLNFFLDGFLWGILLFGIYFFGAFYAKFYIDTFGAKFLLVTLILGYFSLSSALWFLITALGNRGISSLYFKIGWSSLITIGYIYWLHRISFFFLGAHVFGYPFLHPFIPLAQQPEWLQALSYIGFWKLTSILVMLNAAFCLTLFSKKYRFLAGSMTFLLFIPFGYGWFISLKVNPEVQDVATEFGHFKPELTVPINTLLKQFSDKLTAIINHYPSINYIVCAENTYFNFFNLHTTEEQRSLLSNIPKNRNPFIIFGSPFLEPHEKTRQTTAAYFINKDRIISIYQKKFLFPFGEYIPPLFKRIIPSIATYFPIANITPTPHTNTNDSFICPCAKRTMYFMPQLCSDIFLADYMLTSEDTRPIIFMMKESHFPPYIQKLMNLFIKLKALELQRIILLVSHEQGGWFIDQQGIIIPIVSLALP